MKDGEFLNEDLSCAPGLIEHILVPQRVLWSSFKIYFIYSLSKMLLQHSVEGAECCLCSSRLSQNF